MRSRNLPLAGSAVFFASLVLPSPATAQTVHIVRFGIDNIQDAINNAVDGDIVRIDPGYFYERLNFLGKKILVTGSLPGPTIIDGELMGPVVTFENGETAATLLANVTLTRGRADNGGGIYCLDSGPRIQNCRIDNCEAENASGTGTGGGVYTEVSQASSLSPTFTDCTIQLNTAQRRGGGVYVTTTGASGANRATFTRCQILDNVAMFEEGGGVFVQGRSLPVFARCHIEQNEATQSTGGGIATYEGSTLLVTETVIARNEAATGGGGVSVREPDGGLFQHCTVESNVVTGTLSGSNGGGILAADDGTFSDPIMFDNCLIVRNEAEDGGGVWLQDAWSPFSSCTLSENVARAAGGTGGLRQFLASFITAAYPRLENSILWANIGSAPAPWEKELRLPGGVSFPLPAYCDIELSTGAPWASATVWDQSPMFLTGYSDPYAPVPDFFLHQWIANICVDSGSMPAAGSSVMGRSTRVDGKVDTGTIDLGYHYPRL